MGTKYDSNSISGYNSTPPPDDGSVSEANKVKWSTIKNKLTDPTKALAEAINTDINTALDYGPISVVSAAVTLGASHNNQFIEMSGASTPTLQDAATLGAGWFCDLKNAGTSTITIARTTSTDTIDTVTADGTLTPLGYIRYVVNAAANGFVTGGIAQSATQAQTDAGTVSDAYVSPEKLKQWVINTLASTQTDTDAGTRSDVCVTPETLSSGTIIRATAGSTRRAALDEVVSTLTGDGLSIAVESSVLRYAVSLEFSQEHSYSGSSPIVLPAGIHYIVLQSANHVLEVQINSSWENVATGAGTFFIWSDGTNMRLRDTTGATFSAVKTRDYYLGDI